MNTIVQKAVDQINEQVENQVIQEGVRLAECIKKEKAKIAAGNQHIEALATEAKAMAHDEVTPQSLLGSALPINSNTETIAAVIVKANKDRQYEVEQKTKRLTDSILAEQDAIKLVEKRIAELVEALNKLEAPTVTVSQIVG